MSKQTTPTTKCPHALTCECEKCNSPCDDHGTVGRQAPEFKFFSWLISPFKACLSNLTRLVVIFAVVYAAFWVL